MTDPNKTVQIKLAPREAIWLKCVMRTFPDHHPDASHESQRWAVDVQGQIRAQVTDKGSVSPLPVFVVDDDPRQDCYPDERWWSAIAAETPAQAVAIACSIYDGGAPIHEIDWREAFHVRKPIDTAKWDDPPTHPQKIRCTSQLRDCGISEDGETYCDCCGLAANGMPQHAVCEDCSICLTCGGCECEQESQGRQRNEH